MPLPRELVAFARLAFGLALAGAVGVVHASSPVRSLRNGLLVTETIRRPGEANARELAGSPIAARKGVASLPASALVSGAQEVVLGNTEANESFNQAQQEVAALPGGGFGVVWTSGVYPETDVRAQWVDDSGRPAFGPEGRGLATQPGVEEGAVILAHPTAGAFVAFLRTNTPVVQLLDGVGEPRWEVEAVDPAYGLAMELHLTADSAGGVFVCFSFFPGSGGRDLRCQHLDASGARLWSDAGLSVIGGASAEIRVLPRGVSDGSGGILLFWRNQRDYFGPVDPGPILMEGQHVAPDGTLLWGPSPKIVATTRLASSNSWSQRIYQVVSDGSGGAVVAFDDWTGTSDLALDVLAQRVSGSGDLLWGAGAVVTGANGHQQQEQTIATADGGAVVLVFEDTGPSSNRLLMFRLSANGSHLWPGGLVLSDPGTAVLDYSGHGWFDGANLHLAWTHQNTPNSFDMDVRYTTFAADGTRTAQTLLTAAPDAQFLMGLAHSPENGATLAVWDDRRKASWDDVDVYGAFVAEGASGDTGRYYSITPCRLLDTRDRGFPLAHAEGFNVSGVCGIPSLARAVALNVTIVAPTGEGYVTLYPALAPPGPLASTVNFQAGQTRANNAVEPLSFGVLQAEPAVANGGSVHLILDVSGYFD